MKKIYRIVKADEYDFSSYTGLFVCAKNKREAQEIILNRYSQYDASKYFIEFVKIASRKTKSGFVLKEWW